MKFLKKIQNLPVKQRKIIFWVIVAILGLSICVLWFKITKERIKGLGKEEFMKEFSLPGLDFDKELLEVPEFGSEEELKKIEEIIKGTEEQRPETNNEQ